MKDRDVNLCYLEHSYLKLAFNDFLKLAQWVVLLNIKIDIEKAKAKL